MSAKRFKARANFPVLGQAAHQEVEVTGGNWVVALGAAARALKKLPGPGGHPILRRRRITAMSIVIELMEGQPATLTDAASQASQGNLLEPSAEDEGG